MSNATMAPKTHLTKSWTTNYTNLKKKELLWIQCYRLSWVTNEKKSVNCLWYTKHLISASILYLQHGQDTYNAIDAFRP